MILKIDNIIDRCVIFLIIMLSGSLLEVGFAKPVFFTVFSIVIFSVIRGQFHSKKELLFVVCCFFLIVSGLIFNFVFSISDDFSYYITIIAMFLLTLLVRYSFKYRKENIANHLFVVLKIITIYSLLNFLVTNVFHGSISFLSLGESGYYCYEISNVFFYKSLAYVAGFAIYRNQGFFWEPGVLSVFANVYLFMSLFTHKNKKDVLLACFCIITTFSTTGIFLLMLQFVIYLKKNKISFRKKITIFFLFVIPLFTYFLINFQDKVEDSKDTDKSSFGLRLFDFYSGAMVAIHNPFVGVGINKKAFVKERDRVMPTEIQPFLLLIKNRGNSNSLMHVFFMFGIFIGTLILYLLYNQNDIVNNRKLFFTVIIICIIGEPIVLSPFVMFFICSGLENKLKIRK